MKCQNSFIAKIGSFQSLSSEHSSTYFYFNSLLGGSPGKEAENLTVDLLKPARPLDSNSFNCFESPIAHLIINERSWEISFLLDRTRPQSNLFIPCFDLIYPRPTNGICVAMTVICNTFASKGIFAIVQNASVASRIDMFGSLTFEPFACRAPSLVLVA